MELQGNTANVPGSGQGIGEGKYAFLGRVYELGNFRSPGPNRCGTFGRPSTCAWPHPPGRERPWMLGIKSNLTRPLSEGGELPLGALGLNTLWADIERVS